MSIKLGLLSSSLQSAVPIPTTGSMIFSLRKINSTYLGSAIRVRRSSDNTETDIGFLGNYIDQTSLTNFVGSSSGFVTKWYDQGQYSKDLLQSTQANQPRIINAGSLEQVNGKIAINFDGSNDSLSCSFTAINNTLNKMSMFQVFKINATGQYVIGTISGQYYGSGLNGSGSGTDQFVISPKYKNNVLTTITTQAQNWTNLNTNSQILFSQFSSARPTTVGLGISNFSSWELKGWFQEQIYYLNDQFTNLSTINSNINSFYSIY